MKINTPEIRLTPAAKKLMPMKTIAVKLVSYVSVASERKCFLLQEKNSNYWKCSFQRIILLFFSIEKTKNVQSPVLVIHGTEDEVIDFSHGLAIYEKLPKAVEPLWVEGAGHNDVELYGQYLERLKQFVQYDLVKD